MGYSNTSKGRGIKGSKYWMQRVIEEDTLRSKLDAMIGETLEWISHLAGPQKTYDEYQLNDRCICEKIKISQQEANDLFSFWPKRQPQWDGIAFNTTGETIYLVEAKAHLSELDSKCAATNENSKKMIINSMSDVKNLYYSEGDFEYWVNKYYQLGNRLTFLKKLSEKPFGKVVSVKLVLLNFVNDTYIPTSEEEWKEHYKLVWKKMTGVENPPDDVLVINYDVT
jgi:hypothetical protein